MLISHQIKQVFYHKFCTAFVLYCSLVLLVEAELREENLEVLAELYDFNQQIFLKSMEGGIANAPTYVYSIRNGVEIGLGVFKRENSEDLALKRLMLLEKMKNDGFLFLPKIIKNSHGGYLTNINGEIYSCFEYLPPDMDQKHLSLSQMFELIGKFHSSSCLYQNEQDLCMDVIENYKKRVAYFSDNFLKENDPSLFNTEIWKQIIIQSRIYASDEFEKLYNTLPKRIIHGDCHYKNFVISNKIPYFIDFDLMHYGVRLWDLACCITFGYYDEFLNKFEDGTFFSFLELNYGKGGLELEDFEKKYLIEIIKFRELEGAGWLLEEMRQALFEKNTSKYDQFKGYLLRKIIKMKRLIHLKNIQEN